MRQPLFQHSLDDLHSVHFQRAHRDKIPGHCGPRLPGSGAQKRTFLSCTKRTFSLCVYNSWARFPLIVEFKHWLDAVSPTLLPSEPLAVASRYYKNHHDALFRFVDDPLVPIIATCRAQGVAAQAYLAWAFERLGTHRDVFGLPLDALTPAAFKKTLG
ncbi:MAG: transposase [Myxococcales bacterium]|nr:transposase [Myxococcales bacterium]